jgi:hypothetical protein
VVGRGAAVEVGPGVVGFVVEVDVCVAEAAELCVAFTTGVVATCPGWCDRSAGRKIAADAIPMSSASNKSSHALNLLRPRRPAPGMGFTTVVDAGSDGAGSGTGVGNGVSRSAGRDISAIGATADADTMGVGDWFMSACQNS